MKTLTDPLASEVRLAPVATTIAHLRTLAVRRGRGGMRGSGVEMTTYRVRGRLVAARVEEDSDVHLVLADPASGGTMIAEFPALGCTKARRRRGGRRWSAPASPSSRRAPTPAADRSPTSAAAQRLQSVGFFDFKHGQRGVAPNAIELHPVLAFSGACSQTSGSSEARAAPTNTTPAATAAGASQKCEPGYSPCLPVVADLNCSDIPASKKPVRVTGSDPYRLDADHDGLGCESG